jgi:putative nucleotidyltransferase with HDIG domain
MGLFDWLGWGRTAPRPVGHDLETGGRDDDEDSRLRHWLIRAGLFLGLVVLTVAAFPRGEVYEYAVQVGDTWQQATLEASFDFPIYIDQDRVEARRDTVRKNTAPFFREIPRPREKLAANRDTLAEQLRRTLDAYANFQYHASQGENDAARTDSLRYVQHGRNALASLSSAQWNRLAEQYAIEGPERTTSEGTDASRLDQRLLDRAFELGAQLLNVGVMDQPQDSVTTDVIVVRNEQERSQRTVEKSTVYGLNEAYDYVEEQLRRAYPENPEYADITFELFRGIFQPSLEYLRSETMAERNRRARNVTAIQGGVESGEVIVRQGERVTPEIKRQLTSLERVRNERMSTTNLGKQVLGQLLFTVLAFVFFFYYLYLLRTDVWRDDGDMALVALVLSFVIAMFGVGVRVDWMNLYAVPVALASVLLTIVFNSRIGLFGTLVLAFLGGQMLGLDLEYTLATFFAGAFGIFSVRDIKNRGQFFLSAGLVFLGYLLVLSASWLYLGTPTGRFGEELIFAAIGASFTITASIFLWALERTFDITTDLTLLELSDTNNKPLKDLSLRAPGSFNHSLQVANLAEAAADRIGAHTLLTRVGALYHDIGKMLKPEYFVENQRSGVNPHDRLKPRMSALIIASHVKEGLEMGKEYNLPERVLKFIPAHHGTARIEYFYRKALRTSDQNDAQVLESEFRYPGPKPDSKETGIMMLADSVEAASRSLDDPTHKRLKSLVDLIFRERIDDGQLDNTDLTFRDLRQIKDTFLTMLMGIYHVRVKYPDQEDEGADTEDQSRLTSTDKMRYDDVSVELKKDLWPQEESDEQLEAVPPARDPREPRPELAEASPHYRADQSGMPRQMAPPDVPDATEELSVDEPEDSVSSGDSGTEESQHDPSDQGPLNGEEEDTPKRSK